jgi:tRNA modification GTPase
MIDHDDTIVAIASPTSPAARGVVRLSGDQTVSILDRLGIEVESSGRSWRFESHVDVGTPLGSIPIDVMLWPTSH